MKIGIYGGTFSPVHNGHIRAAKLFMEHVALDKLIIMPAGIPPHKSVSSPVSAELRLEMCKAAFMPLSPIVEVSDYEIKQEGKSYSILTVEHLSELGDLCLLCGEDMICSLHTWYRAEELMQKAEFAAIAREENGDAKVFEAAERLKKDFGAVITVINEEPLEISSTDVRKAISVGEDVSDMIPAEVFKIIQDNGLYRD